MSQLFYHHEPSESDDYYEVVTKDMVTKIESLLDLAKNLIEYYELETLPEEANFYQERQNFPPEFGRITTILSFTIPR